MPTRDEITQRLVELLPKEFQLTPDQATVMWYRNLRKSGGLRLTDQGFQALKMLEIQFWNIDIDSENRVLLNKKILLELDRKIQYPYYIDYRQKRITLFSSSEAMMVTLYGDLKRFLENCS